MVDWMRIYDEVPKTDKSKTNKHKSIIIKEHKSIHQEWILNSSSWELPEEVQEEIWGNTGLQQTEELSQNAYYHFDTKDSGQRESYPNLVKFLEEHGHESITIHIWW